MSLRSKCIVQSKMRQEISIFSKDAKLMVKQSLMNLICVSQMTIIWNCMTIRHPTCMPLKAIWLPQTKLSLELVPANLAQAIIVLMPSLSNNSFLSII